MCWMIWKKSESTIDPTIVMQIEAATLPILADDDLESGRDSRLLIANVVFDLSIVRFFISNGTIVSAVTFAHSFTLLHKHGMM